MNDPLAKTKPDATNNHQQEQVVMTHILSAPLEQVWEAYTDPRHIAQWWGLEGATLVSCEAEAKVGGKWRFVLRGNNNKDYLFSGIFREVVAPVRLVYTDGYGEADVPRPESLVSVVFEQLPNGKTKVTKRSVGTPEAHMVKAAWIKELAESSK